MRVKRFNCNPPTDKSSIQQFETEAGLRLPEGYALFLQQADGGEGFVGNAYVILWGVGELIEMNKAYQAAEYAPGLFVFGSDGGGEAFAFDMRSEVKPIVSVPFVGMELKLARPVAFDITTFLNYSSPESSIAVPNNLRNSRVQECAGKEIFEIQPLILGGSPSDPANKAILTRPQHIEAVRYWNKVVRELRTKG